MKKALFLTAYNRVAYLQQVLFTWESVRGLKDWRFVAMIEPSPVQEQIKEEFELFVAKMGLTDYEIIINPERYGVLHHPWVGFERLFGIGNFDFVVRAEDDLIVSEDILEYFSWAAEAYEHDERVVTVHAFSKGDGDRSEVSLTSEFSPWLWGTWRRKWSGLIGPSWDHDYSTFNGTIGNQAGWDWNLNTRIFPKMNLLSVAPVVSRTNNIGVHGIHGTPENFTVSDYFRPHQPVAQFFPGR